MPGLLTEDVMPAELLLASADVTPPVVLLSDFPPISPPASGSFNILPALLGAVGVGIASTGHHGSGSNITPPPPVVPEASTALSLGAMLLLGGGTMLGVRRKHTSEKPL
jgi:hypothetical protein